MQVSSVILRASDLDRAVVFWTEAVGLPVVDRSPAFVFLDGGGVRVALNAIDRPIEDASLTELVLESPDVEADHAAMSARGVPFEVELRPVMQDGARHLVAAHFHDPDGHLASLTGWVG